MLFTVGLSKKRWLVLLPNVGSLCTIAKQKHEDRIVEEKEKKVKVLFVQFCLTLCDPMDCSPAGFSVHGILLEWAAIPFSRGSAQPRDQTWSPALQADSLPSKPPGKWLYYFARQKGNTK